VVKVLDFGIAKLLSRAPDEATTGEADEHAAADDHARDAGAQHATRPDEDAADADLRRTIDDEPRDELLAAADVPPGVGVEEAAR